jgi:hypothetical protein
MTANKGTIYLQNCKMAVARATRTRFVRNKRGSSLEMSLRTQWSCYPVLKMVKNSRSSKQSSQPVTPASDLDQQWRWPLTLL